MESHSWETHRERAVQWKIQHKTPSFKSGWCCIKKYCKWFTKDYFYNQCPVRSLSEERLAHSCWEFYSLRLSIRTNCLTVTFELNNLLEKLAYHCLVGHLTTCKLLLHQTWWVTILLSLWNLILARGSNQRDVITLTVKITVGVVKGFNPHKVVTE